MSTGLLRGAQGQPGRPRCGRHEAGQGTSNRIDGQGQEEEAALQQVAAAGAPTWLRQVVSGEMEKTDPTAQMEHREGAQEGDLSQTK